MTPLARHEAEIRHIVEWAYYYTEGLDQYRRPKPHHQAAEVYRTRAQHKVFPNRGNRRPPPPL